MLDNLISKGSRKTICLTVHKSVRVPHLDEIRRMRSMGQRAEVNEAILLEVYVLTDACQSLDTIWVKGTANV